MSPKQTRSGLTRPDTTSRVEKSKAITPEVVTNRNLLTIEASEEVIGSDRMPESRDNMPSQGRTSGNSPLRVSAATKVRTPRLKEKEPEQVKNFLVSYDKYVSRAGEEPIENFISADLWNKLQRNKKNIFKPGQSDQIRAYLEKFVERYEEALRMDPLGVAKRDLEFQPKSNMYLACLDHVERGEGYASIAQGRDTKKAILKHTVKTLPKLLGLTKEDVCDENIKDFSVLEKVIEENRRQLMRYKMSNYKRSQRRLERLSMNNVRKLPRKKDKGRRKLQKRKNSETDSSSSSNTESSGSTSSTSSSQVLEAEVRNSASEDSVSSREEYQRPRTNHRTGRNRIKQLKLKETRESGNSSESSTDEKRPVKKNKKKRKTRKKKGKRISKFEVSRAELRSDKDSGEPDSAGYDAQVRGPQEVTEFYVQEATATKVGLCYGCHQPGHIRANCPMLDNRRGQPRRLLGNCFNCGIPGHHYKDCRRPLKPTLADFMARRGQRYPQQDGRQYNPQQPRTFNQITQGGPSYRTGNQLQRGRQQVPVQFQQPMDNKVPQANNPTFRIHEVSVGATPEEIGMQSETSEQNYEADGVTTSERIRLIPKRAQIYAKSGDKWQSIEGKLDTGADKTIGSLPIHRKHCIHVWEMAMETYKVRVADRRPHIVKHKGLIHLKAGDKDLGLVEVLLVDTMNWPTLLVGIEVLQKHGLTASLY